MIATDPTMHRPVLRLSAIATAVDEAKRNAAAAAVGLTSPSRSSSGSSAHRDYPYGKDFVTKNFKSVDALVTALSSAMLELINYDDVVDLLEPSLVTRLRSADFFVHKTDLAQRIVHEASNPARTDLQSRLLSFVTRTQGLAFCLKPTEVSPVVTHSPAPKSATIPPAKPIPGRFREIEELVAALTGEDGASAIMSGEAGVGKTSLALAVMNDVRIRRHFGDSRYWIDCEAIVTGERLIRVVLDCLSTRSGAIEDLMREGASVELKFLNLLDRIGLPNRPAVVAFDNLDTLFDVDPEVAEEVLFALLTKAAIIVTMRGGRRPSIGRVWSWPPPQASYVQPLSPHAWRDAFEMHAGRRLTHSEYERISPILQEIEGYPLALFLLGRRVAGGRSQISDIEEAWRSEVSRTRTPSMPRHASLDVSVWVSLASPVMQSASPFAFDILTLLAHLPLGFNHSTGPSDQMFLVDGLPRSLADALCGSHSQASQAWSACIQSGLAHESPDSGDCLQLLPTLREILRRRLRFHRLDPVVLSNAEGWLLAAWTSEVIPSPPSDSILSSQTYAVQVLSQFDEPVVDEANRWITRHSLIAAVTTHLCALLALHAGHVHSAVALLGASARAYGFSQENLKADISRAAAFNLTCRLRSRRELGEEVIRLCDDEAACWAALGQLDIAPLARNAILALKESFEIRRDGLSRALESSLEEDEWWDGVDENYRNASARMHSLRLKAEAAIQHLRFDDALVLRTAQASWWTCLVEADNILLARAQTLRHRAEAGELRGELAEAKRLRTKEVAAWRVLGIKPETTAAEAAIASLGAQLALKQGRYEESLALRRDEERIWQQVSTPTTLASFATAEVHRLQGFLEAERRQWRVAAMYYRQASELLRAKQDQRPSVFCATRFNIFMAADALDSGKLPWARQLAEAAYSILPAKEFEADPDDAQMHEAFHMAISNEADGRFASAAGYYNDTARYERQRDEMPARVFADLCEERAEACQRVARQFERSRRDLMASCGLS